MILDALGYNREMEHNQEKPEMFREAIANAFDHIIITDPDGKILYANKAAQELTGYSHQEMLGQRPSLWGQQMPKEFYDEMWKTIRTDKKLFRAELVNRRKSGETYDAEVRIVPILDDRGEVIFFVGIERDISQAKAVDRAKTEFVSIASHQLGSPITSLRWTLESFAATISNPTEKQHKYLEELNIAVDRIKRLVNDLLSLARIETGRLEVHRESLNIPQFIAKFIEDMQPYATVKKHKITLHDHSGGLYLLSADPTLLYNVMQNLFSNAVDFSPADTAITIELNAEHDGLKISIFNQGPAIPVQDQAHIFERFYRAQQGREMKSEGTGLGLSIARMLVERFGGRIGFRSVVDGDTEFWFTVPRTSPLGKPSV